MLGHWLVTSLALSAAATQRCGGPALYNVSGAVSTDTDGTSVSVVWSSAASGAAAALLAHVLRALSYSNVTLDRHGSAALCDLERRQRDYPQRLLVVPVADITDQLCDDRQLTLRRTSVAPLSVTLYMRLATSAVNDPACARLYLWTATPELLIRCNFVLTSSSRMTIYTTEEVRDSDQLSAVFERAAAVRLKASLTVLSRTQLHAHIANSSQSFLVLDYLIWESNELVAISLPTVGHHAYQQHLQPELVVYNKLGYDQPLLDRAVEAFNPTRQELRTVLEIASEHCAESQRTGTQRTRSECLEYAACSRAARYPARLRHWMNLGNDTYHILVLYCDNDPNYTQVYEHAEKQLRNYRKHLKITIMMKPVNISCSSDKDDSARVITEKKKMVSIHRCIGVVTGAADAELAAEQAQISHLPFIFYKMTATIPYESRSSVCSISDFSAAIKHLLIGLGWRRIVTLSEQTKVAKEFVSALKSSGNFLVKDIKLTKNVSEALTALELLDGRVVIVNADQSVSEQVAARAARRGLGPGRAWLVRSWDVARPGPLPLFHLRCGCRGLDQRYNAEHATSLLDAILTLGFGFKDFVTKNPSFRNKVTERNLTYFWQSLDELKYEDSCQTIKYEGSTLANPTVLVDKLYTDRNEKLGILKVRHGASIQVYSEPQVLKAYESKENIPNDGSSACSTPTGDPFQPQCMDAVCAAAGLLLALAVPLALVLRRRVTREARRRRAVPRHVAPQLTRFLVDRAHIHTYDILGTGRFGRVHLAVLRVPGIAARPIAVKSLRTGAAPAEETEFLNEAVILSGLKHEHVVRFVGACVTKGPPLVLMEHAFFGDLQRYLHERRHLVEDTDRLSADSQDFEEAEHVSAEALTRLGSEAALALAHLARCGIVHRDLRASNCLVDSQRRLKLGDFGMARRTQAVGDNGEEMYACRRRGLFPVLWMAPESLSRGAFSSASDVWSLGVLLLETVTLGARPYGAWSPLRVLQHVSGGGRPELPMCASAEARGVTQACWQRVPQDRPAAGEVARYLCQHPRALRPAPLLPPPRSSPDYDSGCGGSDPPSPSSLTRFTTLQRLQSNDLNQI